MLQSVSELSGSLRALTPGFHATRCIADDLLAARLGLIAHVAMKRRKFERGRFWQSPTKDRMTAHSLDFTFPGTDLAWPRRRARCARAVFDHAPGLKTRRDIPIGSTPALRV
jgi:hypothetical protein